MQQRGAGRHLQFAGPDQAGLGMRVVWRSGEDERFHLGRLGHFLLEDEMTRVNFDFTRDVCYAAAAHLDEDWQIEQWGADDEAMTRRAYRWTEMKAAADLLRAVS